MRAIAHLLLMCTVASAGLAADATREAQVDDIREAVFRWQFENNSSAQQGKAQVYFLAVSATGDDPSGAFMQRFAGHKPAVRKVSASKASALEGVVDKNTGEKGLIFRVLDIEWTSDTEVQVSGGYYEAGLSASGNTYTVKKQEGRWTVTTDTLQWIA